MRSGFPVPIRRRTARGATLAEFIVVVPTMLMLILAVLQAAFAFYAKGQLNYAATEAVRAGIVGNADPLKMKVAMAKALAGYFGGGTTDAALATSTGKAAAEVFNPAALRFEVLSPTTESFADYNSPALQQQLNTGNQRVIPNDFIGQIACPKDVPNCKSDPKTNQSGQTLADANVLAIRVTYGIPTNKQMPLVGRFYSWAMLHMSPGEPDAFTTALVAQGRIPITARAVMRMESAAIENSNVSNPGPGDNGTPVNGPGAPGGIPGPKCPWWDPSCAICKDGAGVSPCTPPPPPCDPNTDPNQCRPPGCKSGDPSCDPKCNSPTLCCCNPTCTRPKGSPWNGSVSQCCPAP